MTLHVPLDKGDSLTDNTLLMTWSRPWAHSFHPLILCEKLDASFILRETCPSAQAHSVNVNFGAVQTGEEKAPGWP